MSDEFPRVKDPADPRRCQAIAGDRQCLNRALDGSQYCAAHGGNQAVEAAEKRSIYDLRVNRVKAEIQRQAGHPQIMKLNEEIGVMRTIVRDMLNQYGTDEAALVRNSGSIASMIRDINTLVTSYERLLTRCGETLGKDQLVAFAMRISSAATEYIKDPTKIGLFVQDVQKIVESLDEEN